MKKNILDALHYEKSNILFALYYYNIIFLFFVFGLFFLSILAGDNQIFAGETMLQVRSIGTIPILIFWIWNMVIWSKHDKKAERFLLIFFLNGIYCPFYFNRALKNKWIK